MSRREALTELANHFSNEHVGDWETLLQWRLVCCMSRIHRLIEVDYTAKAIGIV